MALKPLPPENDPYGAGLASLADVLARIHARTGLPVAAESFRAPSVGWGELQGDTVGEATRAVLQNPLIKLRGVSRFVWKGVGGWLVARTPDAWDLRQGEIPEGSLVPLERKATPTLDDYARLAGGLTEGQRAALEYFRPLATFPTIALREGYWGFLIYDALPSALRLNVENGIRYGDLPPRAQERWRRAVVDRACRTLVKEEWMNAVLADRIPPDAGFLVIEGPDYVNRIRVFPLVRNDPSNPTRYHAFDFRFGRGDAFDVLAPTVPVAP